MFRSLMKLIDSNPYLILVFLLIITLLLSIAFVCFYVAVVAGVIG